MDPAGRDSGLRRLSQLTRWTVGGAVVLAGVFSAVVAQARPGHAKAGSVTATTLPAPAPGDTVLQPPVQPPTRGGGGAVVTSGAS